MCKQCDKNMKRLLAALGSDAGVGAGADGDSVVKIDIRHMTTATQAVSALKEVVMLIGSKLLNERAIGGVLRAASAGSAVAIDRAVFSAVFDKLQTGVMERAEAFSDLIMDSLIAERGDDAKAEIITDLLLPLGEVLIGLCDQFVKKIDTAVAVAVTEESDDDALLRMSALDGSAVRADVMPVLRSRRSERDH